MTYKATISRFIDSKTVIKDEMRTDELSDLLKILGRSYDDDVLEIHIVREK